MGENTSWFVLIRGYWQIERKNKFFQEQLLDMSCQWKNKIISIRINGYLSYKFEFFKNVNALKTAGVKKKQPN
ncbi:hypothetical protein BpHYR1_016769 [Brachionus plicatilis]|uniref:Uncharacterized protein n=1 Tax=Brachionus plicatilis TaxID=10195 RepID=A0A3M7RR93_BRAPC|nr:hypothetical protein BpHYR1_016769 [Brachionus plicatilis]